MNWELICHVLEPFGIIEKQRKDFHAASRLMLFAPDAVDFPGVAYVAAGAHSGGPFHSSLLICTGEARVAAENRIVLGHGELWAVFNALAEAKGFLDTLSDILSPLDSDQDILDAACMYLHVPLIYMDESYRIQAITQDIVFDIDDEWRHMVGKRYLSPENARKMKENGDLDRLAAAQGPVVYPAGLFPYTSINSDIVSGGQFCGRLTMLCIGGDASPLMLEASAIITAQLKRNLARSGMGGNSPVRNMLIELLNGGHLPEPLINDRLAGSLAWNGGSFTVFCIGIDVRCDLQVAAYYSFLLDSLQLGGNTVSVPYDNKTVLLTHSTQEDTLDTLTEKLNTFLIDQRLECGVSNRFSALGELRSYYRQALFALQQESGERLRFYKSYMLRDILSYIPNGETARLISPDIRTLQAADAKHSLALADTLCAYLSNNCNLTRTAEKLYIHKNTLLYRLSRIRSLLGSDFESADERLLLALSFKLLEREA